MSFTPYILITLFHRILVVLKLDCFSVNLLGYVIKFTPMVRHILFVTSFSGLYLNTTMIHTLT